jgi:peptidoglycan/LPS O-acetylase OafA/YrhL
MANMAGVRARLNTSPARSFATEYDRSSNSFTAVRLVLAVAVLYTHSYAIVGSKQGDELWRLTHVTMGHLAVVAFFVISGYLVTQSLATGRSSHKLLSFIVKRGLRIMPGLIVCTIGMSFVVGPFFGHRSLQDYYSFKGGWSPWWYTFDTLTFNLFSNYFGWHTRLHDAFVNTPMSASVNGSLWSLRFEVATYLMLLVGAFLCRYRLRLYTGILAVAGFGAVVLYHFGVHQLPFQTVWVFKEWDTVLSVTPYFFVGAAIYAFRNRVPYSAGLAGFLAVVALLACATTLREIVWVVAVPYLVLMIGTSKNFAWFDRHFGDYSYGTYIYAWPVQQVVETVLKIKVPDLLFAIALPITLALAFVSWHVVEHPALRLKTRSGGAKPSVAAKTDEEPSPKESVPEPLTAPEPLGAP